MLCETKADFELLILLCPPPKFWGHRYAPACLLPAVLGVELTASCVICNTTLQTELQSRPKHSYPWTLYAALQTELQSRSEHGYPQTLSSVFEHLSCWVGKVKLKGWLRENRKQIALAAERWGQLALRETILPSRDRKGVPPPSLPGAQLPNSVRLKNPPCFVRISKYQEENSIWESPASIVAFKVSTTTKQKEKKEGPQSQQCSSLISNLTASPQL